MKMAPFLFIFVLLSAPFDAIADPDAGDANSANNPYAQYDPDGVPLYITQGKRKRLPTQEEIVALQKQQAQIAYDRNWLLRTYEEQLRLNSAKSTNKKDGTTSNVYYELSQNPDLAKLARLPGADTNTPESDPSATTSSSEDSHPAKPRTEDTSSSSSSSDSKTAPLTMMNYKPLITPLSEVDSAGHSLFGYTPISPFSTDGNVNTASTPAPKPTTAPDSSLDAVDLQTPGMVAAKGDALSDPNLTDLTIDALPGETIEQARARIEMNNNPQLPVAMDADELHKEQDLQMHPATAVAKAPTATSEPPVVQPVPPPVNETPLPISKIPQISPVHPAIKDPYDILNP